MSSFTYKKWDNLDTSDEEEYDFVKDDFNSSHSQKTTKKPFIDSLKDQAALLFQAENYNKCITVYKDIISAATHDQSNRDVALINSCCLNIVAALIKLERFDEVAEFCSKVLSSKNVQPNVCVKEKDVDLFKALHFRGYSFYECGEYEKAKEDLLLAKSISPSGFDICDLEDSLTNVLKDLEVISKARCLLQSAMKCFQDKKFSDSIAFCTKAMKLCHTLKDLKLIGYIHSNLASAYFKTGGKDNLNCSVTHFKEAIAIAKTKKDNLRLIELYSGLGAAYTNMGEMSEAIQIFELSIILIKEKDVKAELLCNLYYNWGRASCVLKDYDTSMAQLLQAKDLAFINKNVKFSFSVIQWIVRVLEHQGKSGIYGAKLIKEVLELAESEKEMKVYEEVLLFFLSQIKSGGQELKYEDIVKDAYATFQHQCNVEGQILALSILISHKFKTKEDFKQTLFLLQELDKVDVNNMSEWPETSKLQFINVLDQHILALQNGFFIEMYSEDDTAEAVISVLQKELTICKSLKQPQYSKLSSILQLLASTTGDNQEQIEYLEEAFKYLKHFQVKAVIELKNFSSKNDKYRELECQLSEAKLSMNALLTTLAENFGRLGNIWKAEKYLQEAKELCKKNNDDTGLFDKLIAIGAIFRTKGNFVEARKYFVEAVHLIQKLPIDEAAMKSKRKEVNFMIEDLASQIKKIADTEEAKASQVCATRTERMFDQSVAIIVLIIAILVYYFINHS